MPEIIEIEIYRRWGEAMVGRRIETVVADDDWFLKDGATADAVAVVAEGSTVDAVRRRGKLMLVDLSSGVTLGWRYGMTGRLIVDDEAAIDQLEYSSMRDEPAWDRFVLHFDDGGSARIRDPRRLGGVSIDPDEDALGMDAFALTPSELRDRVAVGSVAIKARLLDQQRVAGIGNLIADETLWRAGIDPARAAGELDDGERRRLLRHLRSVLADFDRDGGSHTGRLHESRVRGGLCPRDGAPLDRRTIGGRTTFSCPQHQA